MHRTRVSNVTHVYKYTWGLTWNSIRTDGEPSLMRRLRHKGTHTLEMAVGCNGQIARRIRARRERKEKAVEAVRRLSYSMGLWRMLNNVVFAFGG